MSALSHGPHTTVGLRYPPKSPQKIRCANACLQKANDHWRWLDDNSWGISLGQDFPSHLIVWSNGNASVFIDITLCLASLDCSLGPKWKRCLGRSFSKDSNPLIRCLSVWSLFSLSHHLELMWENGRKLNAKLWRLISQGGSLWVLLFLSDQPDNTSESLVFQSPQYPGILGVPHRSLTHVIKNLTLNLHQRQTFPLYLCKCVDPGEAKQEKKKINRSSVQSECWRCAWCFWLMLEPIWRSVRGKRWG